jgi:hypothetical protein
MRIICMKSNPKNHLNFKEIELTQNVAILIFPSYIYLSIGTWVVTKKETVFIYVIQYQWITSAIFRIKMNTIRLIIDVTIRVNSKFIPYLLKYFCINVSDSFFLDIP